MPCFGYSIAVSRIGRFMQEKAEEYQVPKTGWGKLQKGECVQVGDILVTPDMVLGPARKGLRVTYCTDSRPTQSIVEAARRADLLVCEGMYGEDGKEQKARENKHMTFKEAAMIAREAAPARMWLTHYSPLLTRPEMYMDKVRKIFPASEAGKDGKSIELRFAEDEE
jgi:ribonuclease Z